VSRLCKPNCKPTTQYGTARGSTAQDHRIRNAKLEHTLSYRAARTRMRLLELENRCTGNRTVGSNPTLSANSLAVGMSRSPRNANTLQTFRNGSERYSESTLSL
jgi:hypothetical protein